MYVRCLCSLWCLDYIISESCAGISQSMKVQLPTHQVNVKLYFVVATCGSRKIEWITGCLFILPNSLSIWVIDSYWIFVRDFVTQYIFSNRNVWKCEGPTSLSPVWSSAILTILIFSLKGNVSENSFANWIEAIAPTPITTNREKIMIGEFFKLYPLIV